MQSKNRAQRRAMEREIEKQLEHPKVVKANEAFNQIKSRLLEFGWEFEKEIGNAVEYGNKWEITLSPALKFINKVFNVKIVPNSNGIEISRIEVRPLYQRNGYAGDFLKSFLSYLLQNGIENIYLIPMPAGVPDERSFLSLAPEELEQFFHKRGFQEGSGGNCWKLNKEEFQKHLAEEVPESTILSKDYEPDEFRNNSNLRIQPIVLYQPPSNSNGDRA